MIRMNYPTPPLAHLRLRLELATRRTRRALEERRRALRTEAAARRAARNEYLRLRWREDLARERNVFCTFYDQYDALVGLLCLAAQEGVTPAWEEEYRQRRDWFCTHYPAVKGFVGAHLDQDSSDSIPGLFGRRLCDAFEALFFPATLEGMLDADGGHLIGRLIRTQNAVAAWEEDLQRKERACDGRAS